MNTETRNGNYSNGITSLPARPDSDDVTVVVAPSEVRSNMPVVAQTVEARNTNSLLTRLRDKWGNRLPESFAASVPFLPNKPLEESPLASTFAVIAAERPGQAGRLAALYERLMQALDRLIAVRAEEEAQIEACNGRVMSRKAAISGEQARLEAARDAVQPEVRSDLKDIEPVLAAAHEEATHKVAATGGTYDPDMPSDACVLRHAHKPQEVAAAHLRLPWIPGDAVYAWVHRLSWALTLLVGAWIGLSIGFVTGIVHPGSLDREWPQAVLLFVLGQVVSVPAYLGIFHTFRIATQRYYLDHKPLSWAPFAALGVAASLAIVCLCANTDRLGLVHLIQLNDATAALDGQQHTSANDMGYWLVALLVSVPFAIATAAEAYLSGRRTAVPNRIEAERHDHFQQTDTARRAEPVVQEALRVIAYVNEILRRQSALRTQLDAGEAPFTRKLDALTAESGSLQETHALDDAALRRIQDAHDNAQWAQLWLDFEIEWALDECEPSHSFWRRLRRALFRPRAPRRFSRSKRR